MVLDEEGVIVTDRSRWFQRLVSPVPVDIAESDVDDFGRVASIAQVLVENIVFLEPDRGVVGVR